jgi:hypothetical protein
VNRLKIQACATEIETATFRRGFGRKAAETAQLAAHDDSRSTRRAISAGDAGWNGAERHRQPNLIVPAQQEIIWLSRK